MTNIYLAASYSRKEEMREVRDVLVKAGHTVTSTWIDRPDKHNNSDVDWNMMQQLPYVCAGYAGQDLDDICNATALIMFTESLGESTSSGGRHTEYGIALALGMDVVIVGPRENIFQCLPIVWRHNSWEELVAELWRGATIVEAERLVRDKFAEDNR